MNSGRKHQMEDKKEGKTKKIKLGYEPNLKIYIYLVWKMSDGVNINTWKYAMVTSQLLYVII